MCISINNHQFKKAIVLFWLAWWSIALWTDIVGALAHFGYLHATWAPDTNYPFLEKSLQMYNPPAALILILFIAIILWSFISTLFFLWASLGLMQNQLVWMKRARNAFIISLSYWLAFFLADQLIMNFELEQNHMVQGGFQLLTFLALYLLPEEE